MQSVSLSRRLVAEAIGVFSIVFFGCGAAMVAERFPGSFPPAGVALVFGLVVTAAAYTLGHISGAHMNPAVTLAFAWVKKFSWGEVFPYWLAQFCGGLFAQVMLVVLLPEGKTFGATVPAVTLVQAFGWEVIMTGFLMFAIMSLGTDGRAEGTLCALVAGVIVALEAMVGGPVTGCSLNPARTLGSNLIAGEMNVYWLYFVAPCLGAVIAASAYSWVAGLETVKARRPEKEVIGEPVTA